MEENMLQPTKMSDSAMLQINTAVDFLVTEGNISTSVTYRLANNPNRVTMIFVEGRTIYWKYLNARYFCKSFI